MFPFDDGLFIKPLCFVSTAAYGSAMAPEVVAFRAFRDRYLMGSAIGRAFVDLYYTASPPAAGVIARSGVLRAAVRFALAPAARISTFAVSASPAEKGTVAAVLLLLAAGLTARKRAGKSGGW